MNEQELKELIRTVTAQVLAGLEDGRVTRDEMCVAVENLLRFVMNSPSCQ